MPAALWAGHCKQHTVQALFGWHVFGLQKVSINVAVRCGMLLTTEPLKA